MQSEPDGVEVVATRAHAARLPAPPLLVVDAIETYLDELEIGSGHMMWSRIGDGQSNVTYLISRGGTEVVLRRGPRPPLPRSTHDMVREARIQHLLHAEGIPVPQVLAVCEDDARLGVPFYLMEYVLGDVITDSIPPHLNSLEQRRATAIQLVDTLVQLHDVDIGRGELAGFGRPDGYLKRQVERFSSLWLPNTQRALPQVAAIGHWLIEHLPKTQKSAIVHGDYRLGNLMFGDEAPATVRAVLDWEMAALGDPLADLGYLTATYAADDHVPTLMELSPVTREAGFLTSAEIIERYQSRSGLDVSGLGWYQTLALWKSAIFCEAIYTRWLQRERPDDATFAPTLLEGVPALLRQAAVFADMH